MEIYFNELSIRKASSEAEALAWLKELIALCKFIKRIVDSLDKNNSFMLRTTHNFRNELLFDSQSVIDFAHILEGAEQEAFLAILDSPHLFDTDPQKNEYEYTNLFFEGKERAETGLTASYLKKGLCVSLNNDSKWDTCHVAIGIKQLKEIDGKSKEVISQHKIKHASQIRHIKDCHLDFLKTFYDLTNYRPQFEASDKKQNLLYFVEIYSLILGDDSEQAWKDFYAKLANRDKKDKKLNERDRIAKIKEIAEHIAQVQGWTDANLSLKRKNTNRTLYMIPNSEFIVSVDILHGDFEILLNEKSPNHCGSVSFDGKRFKEGEKDHSINI